MRSRTPDPTSIAAVSLAAPGFNGEVHEPYGWQILGNGYRAYNPALMRFHSPDDQSPFGAGGINAYAYCGNDPVNHTDPTGHYPGLSLIFSRIIRPLLRRRAALAGRLAAPRNRASVIKEVKAGTTIAQASKRARDPDLIEYRLRREAIINTREDGIVILGKQHTTPDQFTTPINIHFMDYELNRLSSAGGRRPLFTGEMNMPPVSRTIQAGQSLEDISIGITVSKKTRGAYIKAIRDTVKANQHWRYDIIAPGRGRAYGRGVRLSRIVQDIRKQAPNVMNVYLLP